MVEIKKTMSMRFNLFVALPKTSRGFLVDLRLASEQHVVPSRPIRLAYSRRARETFAFDRLNRSSAPGSTKGNAPAQGGTTS